MYTYIHTMTRRAFCNAHTCQYVCDHKRFSSRICCMALPNRHIGAEAQLTACVWGGMTSRALLQSMSRLKLTFSVNAYVYTCVLTQLTGQPNVVLERLAR